jgi:hypothetical protein
MKTKIFILLFSLTVIVHTGFSQNSIQNGLELGFSISRFPGFTTYSRGSKDYYLPILSPLIGFSRNHPFANNFQLSFGAQYQITGSKHYFETTDFKSIEKTSFHKISLPLLIRYRFKIKKYHLAVFPGLRPNLFLSGQRSYISDHAINSKLNLFDKDQCEITAKRFSTQLLLGLSFNISENMTAGIVSNLGNKITYIWSSGAYHNYITNNDLNVSITYFLKSKNQGRPILPDAHPAVRSSAVSRNP